MKAYKYVIMYIAVGFFNLQRGCLSMHMVPPVNVAIRRTAHCFSIIPANDTKKSFFGHRNFSLPTAEIEPGISSTKAQCAKAIQYYIMIASVSFLFFYFIYLFILLLLLLFYFFFYYYFFFFLYYWEM